MVLEFEVIGAYKITEYPGDSIVYPICPFNPPKIPTLTSIHIHDVDKGGTYALGLRVPGVAKRGLFADTHNYFPHEQQKVVTIGICHKQKRPSALNPRL